MENDKLSSHLSVWLDAMLETIQLPASISNLATSLANVDGDTLTLANEKIEYILLEVQAHCVRSPSSALRCCLTEEVKTT